jgi:replicative DNA helicase
LDYADLLAPERADATELYASGADVYNHLRGWLVEDRLVGWTGLQSGRSAMEVTVADQHHTGGSIAKAQIADLIVSINRSPEEETKGYTNLFIVKNRDGPARYSIAIKTDFNRMAFWRRIE